MALKAYRILPGRGLDLTRIDDRSLEGAPLRGCDNVRVVDGEWWIREGELVRRWFPTGAAFVHAVSLDLQYGNTVYRRHFLIGRHAVAEGDMSDGWSLSVPYLPEWQASVRATNGYGYVTIASVSALGGTVTNAIRAGDLIRLKDYDSKYTLYRVESVTGTGGGVGDIVTLDRSYAGPSEASQSSKAWARFGSADVEAGGPHACSWTVFRQYVDHAIGSVWNTGAVSAPYFREQSPAAVKGGIYLVVCHGALPSPSGGGPGPVAIRLDVGSRCQFEFMRMTQASVTAATAFNGSDTPMLCETYKGRLIVVRADENNANDDRTVWYSRDGDMQYWHTGVAGGSPAATHNLIRLTEGHDPVTALAKLGDDLVVHRERSQEVFKFNASEVTPFTIERNDQALGCVARGSLVNVRGTHVFWTESGPASFDGERVYLLPPGIGQVAALYRTTSEWSAVAYNSGNPIASVWPRGIVAAYHACRQQIRWLPMLAIDRYAEMSTTSGQHLCYDLNSEAAWLCSYPGDGHSIGCFRSTEDGREMLIGLRADGTVTQLTQTNLAKDTGSAPGATADEPYAYLETAWLDFDSEVEKEILKIQIEFRAVPAETGQLFIEDYVTDATWDGDGDAKFLLQVFTDASVVGDVTRFTSETLRLPLSDMSDIESYPEGARLPGRVTLVPKLRIQGEQFKLRFYNYAADITNKRPFRISQVTVFFEERESTRRETRQ